MRWKKIFFFIAACLIIIQVQAQVCQVFISHVINGNQVQYFGTSPDGPTNWSWFFNGGTPLTSSLQNQLVTYSTTGQFICALSVFGGPTNCSSSLSHQQDTVTILPTGISTLSFDKSFVIRYKSDVPFFEYNLKNKGEVAIQLFDLSGHYIVDLFRGEMNVGQNIVQIKTNGLTDGIYIVSATGEGEFFSEKFYWKN